MIFNDTEVMLDTTEMSNENEATSEEEKLLREEDSNESIVSSIKDFGETVFLVRKYMLLRQKQYQLDIRVLCILRFQVINCSLLVLAPSSLIMVLR